MDQRTYSSFGFDPHKISIMICYAEYLQTSLEIFIVRYNYKLNHIMSERASIKRLNDKSRCISVYHLGWFRFANHRASMRPRSHQRHNLIQQRAHPWVVLASQEKSSIWTVNHDFCWLLALILTVLVSIILVIHKLYLQEFCLLREQINHWEGFRPFWYSQSLSGLPWHYS